MPRFVLLEHSGAPDDPAGLHWDLLLEAGGRCRTWRLARLPVAGGEPVPAEEIAPHRLAWLDHVAGEVSGGRGFARRVDGGEYEALEPAADEASGTGPQRVRLAGAMLAGTLVFDRTAAGVAASLTARD